MPGKPHVYTVPAQLGLNEWALSGDWTMEEEPTTLNAANGQIACRFHARDLNLVMGPAAPAGPVRCRVLVDGQPPGGAHGSDVDGDGNGTVTQQRVYQLIRQPGPITRLRSRAWKRQAICPFAAFSAVASSSIVQSPDRAHWLSPSLAGTV